MPTTMMGKTIVAINSSMVVKPFSPLITRSAFMLTAIIARGNQKAPFAGGFIVSKLCRLVVQAVLDVGARAVDGAFERRGKYILATLGRGVVTGVATGVSYGVS